MKVSEIQLTYKRVVLNQNGEMLNSSVKVNKFIREYLKAIDQDLTLRECFFAAFFDTALNCIGVLKVADGGIDAVHVDTRLIYSTAVNTGCKGVMLFHNHPSGRINPSQADIQITNKIKKGLSTLEMQLFDHIILDPSTEKYFSFGDEGYL